MANQFLVILFAIFVCVQSSPPPYISTLKSSAPAEVQQKAAEAVIERLLPEHFHLFVIKIEPDTPLPNSYKLYRPRRENASVEVTATSGVAACRGVHDYLKHYCNCHISWDGNQLNLPDELPEVDIQRSSESSVVFYQNVCTWSYSFAWWKWPEWQKHIDWMALNGITLTYAPFQEMIWTKVYTKFGLTALEIDEHIAGPAFLAWQRMGNIRGWGGPLSEQFKNKTLTLQKNILAEMHSLGMMAALPAFAGHLPVAFKRLFPNATLTPVERWNKFPDRFASPLFLDPQDPLFTQIGETFLSAVVEEYGTDHIYFCDPYNEIQPAETTDSYMTSVSRVIYNVMTNVDAKAVWLLQGWMFIKNPIWSDDLIKSFLTAVPIGRMLVLDLQSEQWPQYERTSSYHGQPFIWCMLHNFGGTLGMHGSPNIVNEQIDVARRMTNSSMVGVGITPEGIHQNYIMYDYVLERAWLSPGLDPAKYFEDYITNRYGRNSPGAQKAWQTLLNTVYQFKEVVKFRGKFTICRRPSLKLSPWSWYNHSSVVEAWSSLLSSANDLHDNLLYQHDLVDVTRQFFQNKADDLYIDIRNAYVGRNLTELPRLISQFKDLFNDTDAILATSSDFLLGRWLESAKSWAPDNTTEQRLCEFNARNQITLWGPGGQIVDYANKQWSGMMKDFYLPRWSLFLDELMKAAVTGSKFNEAKVKRRIFEVVEKPFGVERKVYPTEAHGNSVELSQKLFDKWTTRT